MPARRSQSTYSRQVSFRELALPLLITFQGKPVKRRERLGDRLKLILFSPSRGMPGGQLIVTQDEWQKFGRIEFLQRSEMPDVRRMADR